MRISDWSSDVCSSDLYGGVEPVGRARFPGSGTLRSSNGAGPRASSAPSRVHRPLPEPRHADHHPRPRHPPGPRRRRSEEHTSELQSLMRISYAVFCLKKKTANRMRSEENKTEPQSLLDHIECALLLETQQQKHNYISTH